MYLELFKLTELPFRLSPDPAFLYLSKHHARAKAYMESTIWFTDGFVVLTGEIGSGKTTLIETFLRELGKDVVVAQVNQTQVSPTEFLQSVLVQFGFTPFKMKKAELLATINNFLIEQYASGRKVVLIIDEAQNLSNRVLEEVRMLSGVETTKEKVLRIILAGQPELNEKLNAPELVQLTQRVRLRFHLTQLSRPETRNYIEHRLEVAGCQGRHIFEDGTFALIFQYTGGVPRLVNTLCDTAMMSAYGRDSSVVTLGDVEAAIKELQWTDFVSRTNRLLPSAVEPPHANGGDKPDVIGRVLIAHEGQTIAERQLLNGRFIIGRTTDNDLQIDSKYVSRHHCQIISTADGSVIEDLNSTNGIYVKQKRVRKHNLNDGDVVLVGKHELMYIDERSPKHKSTAETSDVPVLDEAGAELSPTSESDRSA
ncbi:MAG TPA: AAA family ATPase [Steroidobacteraceae bacterium]|nr:AAA family ATPase [Steroidobacteraceae bacterium]